MKKTINGKTFEKVGDNYVLNISKKRYIILIPSLNGWIARENRVIGNGSYMSGDKAIATVHEVAGKTLNETAKFILKYVELDSQTRASIKYNETNVKQIKLNLNLKTDADIIKKLEEVGNKQGYIKELIRNNIK